LLLLLYICLLRGWLVVVALRTLSQSAPNRLLGHGAKF
jgi:hypothetical protein